MRGLKSNTETFFVSSGGSVIFGSFLTPQRIRGSQRLCLIQIYALTHSLTPAYIALKTAAAQTPIFRLHRMHEMQTIVTDVRVVCLSVCPSRGTTRLHRAKPAEQIKILFG